MEIKVEPVGFVRNSRTQPEDDHWSSIISEITLADQMPEESLKGIEEYSHLEIIFLFDRVSMNDIILTAEHPRENISYPRIGIFAQRKKNRPNRLGATIVELIKKEGKTISVRNLDAID